MQLSKRLLAVADMVTEGNRLADVGTDHGYVPIYLVKRGRIPWAIAMDVNKGPLARAEKNIAMHAAGQYIETRLSDGVQELHPKEVDSIIIAGMGGSLVIKILTEGEATCRSVDEMILQPQSDIAKVRYYLNEHGYQIICEDMILEDGKFYPMMKVSGMDEQEILKKKYETAENGPEILKGSQKTLTEDEELYNRYGRYLLENQNPVLWQFLEKEAAVIKEIHANIRSMDSTEAVTRRKEIEQEMQYIQAAQKYYEV